MSLSPQTDIAAAATSAKVEPDPQHRMQLQAVLHAVGVAPLGDLGWVRVTGEDRVRWLNGMVTNSINDLKPGEGCYNFILSAQGRIQGTANAFSQPDSILLQTDRAQLPGLIATLDRFIIMDDVELTDITEDRTGIALIGPTATALLTRLDLEAPAPLSLRVTTWQSSEITLIAAHSPLVPRFELWAAPATISALLATLTAAGATPISPEPLEWLRILEGTPRYGTDIRDKELPQETAQTRALHFAKGCYLGQEIVERIRSRGAVHRTFAAFRIEGQLPAPGTPIESEGKPVGELTSTASIPVISGILQIAVGYIRREALERATPLTCAAAVAHPIPLPVREP
jgi:folate-binding protein YgfZ